MRKKITAVVLSCLTAMTLILAAFSTQTRVAAVTLDEMTTVAVQLITKSEGTYNSINPNDNGAVSVGILQWHATRALQLMRSVAQADAATAKSTLGTTFYNEVISASSWETRTFNTTEASKAATLLGTSTSRSIQDQLAYSDVQGYINAGKNYGLTDAGVLVYFATLYNRGSGVAARILSAAKGSGSYSAITLDTLHNTAMNDRGNSSGYYTSRMTDAYNTIVSLGWAGQGTTTGTTPAQPDTSDFSESYAGTYTVNASSLNIRSAPTTSASKVGSIPNGATVTVTSGNGSWAAVTYNGVSGYCSMDYLVKAAAATTTAPAATTTKATTTTTTTAATASATAASTTAAPADQTQAAETTAAQTETTVETTTTEEDFVALVGTPNPAYSSIYGDVNCDGTVDATDAVLLQKYLNGSVYLNYSQLANADCQRDSILNTTDVTVILQYLINNFVDLPVI